ncbi:hypothetical protein EVAR_71932_1 [Eumeta japonica]|uniref:Uncharacterized protein n=1 Tax=Eumeta variegata TaxID=151549 RepID=A0A4C1STK1_EUMVA|nr:hypothetical protein EVAR_71932_1 [Eumeta japonica]
MMVARWLTTWLSILRVRSLLVLLPRGPFLITHTGNLSDPAAAAAALAQSQAQSLWQLLLLVIIPMLSQVLWLRVVPHPLVGLVALIPAAAALGPYHSPYAMYGQRIGSAAVHQ